MTKSPIFRMSERGARILDAKRRRASWHAHPLWEPRAAVQRLTEEINRIARSTR